MSNPFLQRRRPVRLAHLAVIAAVLGVAVAVVVVVQSSPGRGARATRRAPAADRSPASPDAPPGASSRLAVGGPLRLIKGSRVLDGVRVGFPYSGVGAVSAAVEYWTQIASTLDPRRAALLGRLLADGSWRDAPAQLAQGPVNTRRRLGLPAGGLVPAGVSVVLSPVSYQVRDAAAGQITVLLLADLIITMPKADADTRTGVFPLRLRWSTGDWKITAPDDPGSDYSDLVAEPGTPEAAAAGWQMFTR